MKIIKNKSTLFILTVTFLFVGAWSPTIVEQTVKHFTQSEHYENQSFLIICIIAGTAGYIIGRIKNLLLPNPDKFILISASFAFGVSIFLMSQVLTNPNEVYKFYSIPFIAFLFLSYVLIPKNGKVRIIENYDNPKLVTVRSIKNN